MDYGITPAANSTTVPNYNAAQNGGPVEKAAKSAYNFVSEHADPIESAVKAAKAFSEYSSEHNPADLYEGLDALAETAIEIALH